MSLFHFSCGGSSSSDDPAAYSIDVSESDENGTALGKFSKDSDVAQVLAVTTGDIAGTELSIPAGALNIDVDITISPSSDSPASADSAASAGLDGDLSDIGPAISVTASETPELSEPFSLKIPIGISSALVAADKFPVIFVAAIDGDDVTIKILPSSAVTVEDGFATFSTKLFGTFQFAYSSVELTEEATATALDLVGDHKGQRMNFTTDWGPDNPSYSAFGININASSEITKTLNDATYSMDDIPTELQLKLAAIKGKRFLKLEPKTGVVDDERFTMIVAPVDNSGSLLVEFKVDDIEVDIMQKGTYSYPPDSNGDELGSEELKGSFSGDSFRFAKAASLATIEQSTIAEVTRDKITVTEDGTQGIKLAGTILGKTIESSSLELEQGGDAVYHRYHGGLSGTVTIAGKTYSARMVYALNLKSFVLAVCWNTDSEKCWILDNEPVEDSPFQIVVVYVVKK